MPLPVDLEVRLIFFPFFLSFFFYFSVAAHCNYLDNHLFLFHIASLGRVCVSIALFATVIKITFSLLYICTAIYVCKYVYTHTPHTHTHTHTHTHVCIYIHIPSQVIEIVADPPILALQIPMVVRFRFVSPLITL